MKIKKILIILIICLCCLSFFYSSSATVTSQFGGKNMTGDENSEKIIEVLAMVLEIVRNLGVGIALIILIALGCKYMLASAGDRAEIKKYAVTYVIGAVVLFAASGIFEVLKQFALNATNITGSSGPGGNG